MTSLLELCKENDLHGVLGQLALHCTNQKEGLAATNCCSGCILTGVVAAALEGNADIVREFVQGWTHQNATNADHIYSTNQAAQQLCLQAGGAAVAKAASKKLPPHSAEATAASEPIHSPKLLLTNSTTQLSIMGCFSRVFGNAINVAHLHYNLHNLSDGEMPAVLKAAALGGSVAVLKALLEACPAMLDSPTRHGSGSDVSQPTAAALALGSAALRGHADFMRFLLERDVDLQVSVDTLVLAAEGVHLDAITCLLGHHGADARRVVLPTHASASAVSLESRVARAAGLRGHVCLLLQLQHLTAEADGFDGAALMREVFAGDEFNLKYDLWELLKATCTHGSSADLEALLQQENVLRAIQLAATEKDAAWATGKFRYCIQHMINLFHVSDAAAAATAVAKLRLLILLPPPHVFCAPWAPALDAALQRDWADGVRILLHELPAFHEPLPATLNYNHLFRQSCAHNRTAVASALLELTGDRAVDPRASHQAAMRTACWRNMPSVVRLLLQQTGQRAVRMQPGKRSFFYAALRPFSKSIHQGYTDPGHEDGGDAIDPADARMDDRPGGYSCLKLLLGATGISAVPPSMWAHGGDGRCKRADVSAWAGRGPVERQYRDVGWCGGIQRMSRREMVLRRLRHQQGGGA